MSLPFLEWLPSQRWYAGRGRQLISAETTFVTALRDDLDLMLVDTGYADGTTERYQVFVGWDTAPVPEYAEAALIGSSDDGRAGYDALYDPAAAAFLLTLLDGSAELVRSFGGRPQYLRAVRTLEQALYKPESDRPAA